jgi:hypothetical protein
LLRVLLFRFGAVAPDSAGAHGRLGSSSGMISVVGVAAMWLLRHGLSHGKAWPDNAGAAEKKRPAVAAGLSRDGFTAISAGGAGLQTSLSRSFGPPLGQACTRHQLESIRAHVADETNLLSTNPQSHIAALDTRDRRGRLPPNGDLDHDPGLGRHGPDSFPRSDLCPRCRFDGPGRRHTESADRTIGVAGLSG